MMDGMGPFHTRASTKAAQRRQSKLEEAEAAGMTRLGERLRKTGGWQHRQTAIAPGDDLLSTRIAFQQAWCSTFKG